MEADRNNMTSKLERELVLLRHGSTQWNAERRYLGHTDLGLLPSSIEQLTPLKQQPELWGDFWRVYCSDLLRCRETLAALRPELQETAVYDHRLREMNFGEWEGQTYEQLKGDGKYRNWLDDPEIITPPNGESWAEFKGRVDSFLLELFQAAEADAVAVAVHRVLIVTHGGIIRQLLTRAVPGLSFRDSTAPSPGTAYVLRLLWQDNS